MIAPTLAAVVSTVPDTVVTGGPIFQLIEPYLASVIGVVITAVIGWAASLIQRSVGIKIDQANREALHSAAMTGVNLALSKLGAEANNLSFDTKSAVIAQAVTWVEKSVPGALAHFKLTPDKIASIVESKIGAATNTPSVALK